MDGIVILDKPPLITSAGAVGRVKRLLQKGTKIGHAGTLDPFATGVLILLVGKATRSCEKLMDQPKRYDATIKFGSSTATDDLDSPEIPWPITEPPSLETINCAASKLIGLISQRPPAFSALKISGQPAYKLARAGQSVELQPRQVRIDNIQILSWNWPLLKIRVDCGRGTYIRAIARDLGETLNVGGHLTQLRRTRIGEYDITHSVTLDQLLQDGIAPHLKIQ